MLSLASSAKFPVSCKSVQEGLLAKGGEVPAAVDLAATLVAGGDGVWRETEVLIYVNLTALRFFVGGCRFFVAGGLLFGYLFSYFPLTM